ncbi:hypothetical protein NHX12_031178 [Muraenolepis orangiensis]|uniref:Anti-proliferative protein domain-containing protein n=1 Tax=Muraenolepis orangiensis TaxID=630683 RepID=A0A9Q0IH39_9TELE|nr:hypothetical protein NHX12_031178 [Muraenolepis orangiensis]
MHLEVKVALNFIVSYLYNKLPRRRADLFGEELERILVSRFEGHWYPESPLRGSAFRCLHLGAPRDPVVELAAQRSGLDTEEVRANVPAELSIWMDPYEVSYQIGEKGAVKVLYLEDPPGLGCEAELIMADSNGDEAVDEAKSLGFNPDAQVFVPIGGQVSPVFLSSLSGSPTPLSVPPSCPALFSYPSSSTPTAHSSNTSTPSPPMGVLAYLPTQQQQNQQQQQPPPGLPGRPPLQPITFTTASFAATKFGSTKMKKISLAGPPGGSGAVAVPPQRILSRSPPTISPPELLQHKPLVLSLRSLGGPTAPSQLSPSAKEFVYAGSPGPLYFEVDAQPMAPHASPFPPPHPLGSHPAFDPFVGPAVPGQGMGLVGAGGGGMSYTEKPAFVDGLGSYNLQYPSQSFQPVVLAN